MSLISSTTSTQFKQLSSIKIQFQTINSQKHEITINKSMTGLQLKEYIYQNICQSLTVDSMSLAYEGTKIGNSKKLSDLQIVVGNQLKIIQNKLDIGEVADVIAKVHGIDLITGEQGVAQLTCGHHMGRDTMTQFIRSLISQKKNQIRCPFPNQEDTICSQMWDFQDCRKVGVFTAQEIQQFQSGLTINWLNEFSKQCPNCRMQICKNGLLTNRVTCPSCKYNNFCYLCLKKWKIADNNFCGNQDCLFLNEFLASSPWNRKFSLKDKKDNNIVKTYNTPQYRSCPNCNLVIQHIEYCKHMKCKGCQKNFCWVCLAVQVNKTWPCGRFD